MRDYITNQSNPDRKVFGKIFVSVMRYILNTSSYPTFLIQIVKCKKMCLASSFEGIYIQPLFCSHPEMKTKLSILGF